MELNVLFANVCQGLIYRGKDDHGVNRFDGVHPERYAISLAAFQPDIMLCAEMLMDDHHGNSVMAERFSREMGLPHVRNCYVAESWDEPVLGKFFGLSILSRYPISEYEVTPLPNPNLQIVGPDGNLMIMHDKSIQRARIDLPDGQKLRCFNVHSFPFHRFKRSIAEPAFVEWRMEFARLLSPKPGEMLVCSGDFNNRDMPVEVILPDAFTDGRLRKAVERSDKSVHIVPDSHAYDYQAITIDHILCSSDMKVEEAKIIYGDSDHPMLFTRLAY